MPTKPDLILFLGHFHPLLVHLPIGFLLLLVIFELVATRERFKPVGHSRGLILAMALLASIASVVFGLCLSQAGGYEAQLLKWHKWTGIAVGVGCLLMVVLHWRRLMRLYYVALSATVLVLMLASHFGGSITHGKNYLTQYAPESIRELLGEEERQAVAKVSDPQQVVVFTSIVEPILQQKCAACHNAEKLKGKFRVDTIEMLLKGGEHGRVIEPGNAAASALVKAMLLPPSDEKHMPPSGKPQPTGDELALIRWWIDAGASADKKVADLKPTGKVEGIIEAMFGPPEPETPPQKLAAVLPIAEKLSAELGVNIMPLAQDQPWLNCNASLNKEFGDAQLAKLAPLCANLQWLNLGGTKVSDTGLVHVAAMKHLTRLHLEKTAVTDAGLARLAKLHDLEYLNLYGTPISNAGLAPLQRLAKLQKLYLWQTKVTPEAAQAFSAAFVDKQKMQRWQEEIDALKSKIRSASLDLNLGAPLVTNAPPAVTQADVKPINDKCPVSGKDIDPTKTVTHDGKVIAFCCDICKAKFEKNPKGCLAKLNLK